MRNEELNEDGFNIIFTNSITSFDDPSYIEDDWEFYKDEKDHWERLANAKIEESMMASYGLGVHFCDEYEHGTILAQYPLYSPKLLDWEQESINDIYCDAAQEAYEQIVSERDEEEE